VTAGLVSADRGKRLAVVAAVLLVAAVVIAVQFSRLGGPSTAVLPPDAPPAGVDLVYVRDPANPHGLVAYDWRGSRRGSVTLPTWVEIARLRPAPNGSTFMIDPSTPGDYAAYFDRGGRVLFESDDPAFSSQVWADDSTHVCVLADATDGARLITRLPGQRDRTAQTRLASGYTVAGCSLRADTAVVTSGADLELLSLSNGHSILAQRSSAGVLASADGAYVALSFNGAAPVSIYKLPDLSTPLAQLDASLVPFAFSGDDSMLVASVGASGAMRAIAWRSGAVAWSYDSGGAAPDLVLARPAAEDFVLYLVTGPVVVRRDGKTARLG
jgi:hypothetical protein